MPARWKSLAGNLALFAGSCVVSLLLCEWAVRTMSPQQLPEDPHRIHPQGFYTNHPQLGFTMNPQFRGRFRHPEFDTRVHISSLGIRDEEFGPKPPGVRRLLILGDSYAFGWGVEADQRFGSRLAAKLAVAAPGRWQVIQAGINAYATREELGWLDEYGWSLEPDLIVLEFCMGNDFSGNLGPGFHVENGFLVGNDSRPAAGAGSKSWLERLRTWAREHSHLFVFLREVRGDLVAGRTPARKRRQQLERANSQVDEGFAVTKRLLEVLNQDASRHGVPWVLMVVPMRHQIYDAPVSDRPLLDHPNLRLRELGQQLQVPELDLLDAFREWKARGQSRTYFQRDPHWNAAGHDLAAAELFRLMNEYGLVEASRRAAKPAPATETAGVR